MSQDDNIFDTAAKKLSRGKKRIPASARPAKEPKPYRDPETQEMLQRIKEMKDDLDSKIEEIKNQTGPAAEHFKKLLTNQVELSPQEWDDIQLAKKLLGDKLWDSMNQVKEPPKAPPTPSNRKGKTLGARKKWIPMR